MAAIEDCCSALELNPDSAKAFRMRGVACRHLGKWKDAHEDLAKAQALDYDQETALVQQFVDTVYIRCVFVETCSIFFYAPLPSIAVYCSQQGQCRRQWDAMHGTAIPCNGIPSHGMQCQFHGVT